MHQTRQEVSKKIPIPRKGTKYIVRPVGHLQNSVPVVVAVRDMLKLARTSREVKAMIQEKLLKINGKEVYDVRQSITLFSIFEADKNYLLHLSPTGKFVLSETKEKDTRRCKIVNKKLLKGKQVQLNLHDGTNIISKENPSVGSTVYLDFNNKLKKTVSLEKGKDIEVIKGKYSGSKGKITSVEGQKVIINLNFKEQPVTLNQNQVIVI